VVLLQLIPLKYLMNRKVFITTFINQESTDNGCKTGETFLRNLNIPKLSEQQKQSCERMTNHLVIMEYQLNFIKPVGTVSVTLL